jgi:hypothetical protein
MWEKGGAKCSALGWVWEVMGVLLCFVWVAWAFETNT